METRKLNSIQKRIKSRRIELGLSYQQLAERTNISKSTLQRYETGFIKNFPLDKLWILADALETTPNWILSLNTADELPKKQYDIFLKNMNSLMEANHLNFQKLSKKSDLPITLLKSMSTGKIIVSSSVLSLIANSLNVTLGIMLNENLSINTNEKIKLVSEIDKLNVEGQKKALSYIEDLLLSKKYSC